jgi:hypothetical protein
LADNLSLQAHPTPESCVFLTSPSVSLWVIQVHGSKMATTEERVVGWQIHSLSPAIGHDTEILDVYDLDMGYNVE